MDVFSHLQNGELPLKKRFLLAKNCIKLADKEVSISQQVLIDWLYEQFTAVGNDLAVKKEALAAVAELLRFQRNKAESTLIVQQAALEGIVLYIENGEEGLETVVETLNSSLDHMSLLRCIIREEQLLMRLAGALLHQRERLSSNPEYFRLLGRLGFQLQEKNRLNPSVALLRSFVANVLPSAVDLLVSNLDLNNVVEAKNRWKVVVQNFFFANNLYEDWKNSLFSVLGANQKRPYYPESIELIMSALRQVMSEEKKCPVVGEILVEGFVRRYKKSQPEAFIFMAFFFAMLEVYPESKEEPAVISEGSEAALSLKLTSSPSPEIIVQCVLRVLTVLKEKDYNIMTELDGIQFVNWLQNLLQFLMKKFGKTVPSVMKVCEALMVMNPATIQYVPGPIIKSILSSRSNTNELECDTLLAAILKAFVKLRNIPKFVQLLVQASKLLKADKNFVGGKFLDEFENVLTYELISTQVIKLWTQVLEGLEKDLIEDDYESLNPQCLILASILVSGKIVEHTLPEVQLEEMETLTRRTRSMIVTAVEKGYENQKLSSGLLKLVFSFNELHSLLMRYVFVYRQRFLSEQMDTDAEEVPGIIRVAGEKKYAEDVSDLDELNLQSIRLSTSQKTIESVDNYDVAGTQSLSLQFVSLCGSSDPNMCLQLTNHLVESLLTNSEEAKKLLSVLEVTDSRRVQLGVILSTFQQTSEIIKTSSWSKLSSIVNEDQAVWFNLNEKDQKLKIKELSFLVSSDFIEYLPDETDTLDKVVPLLDILLKFPVDSFDISGHGLLLCYLFSVISSTNNTVVLEKAFTLLVLLLDTPEKVSPLFRFFKANEILPWVVEKLRAIPDLKLEKAVLEVVIETATKSMGCMETFPGFAKDEPNDLTRLASVIFLENLRKSRKRLSKSPKLATVDNLLKTLVKSFQKSLKASPALLSDWENPEKNAALLNACSCILQIYFENKSSTKFNVKTVLSRLSKILTIAYEGLRSDSLNWGNEARQLIDLVLDHRSDLANKIPGDMVTKVWDSYKASSLEVRWKDGFIRRIFSSVKKSELARICSDLVEGLRSAVNKSDYSAFVKFNSFLCQLMHCQVPAGPRTDIRRDALHTSFALMQSSRSIWSEGEERIKVSRLIMESYRVLLTAQMLLLSPFELALSMDEIIHAPMEASSSVADFVSLFIPSFKILHSLLTRHEELSADRMPVLLRCFNILLTSVVLRFHQNKNLSEEELKSGIICAEKLGSLGNVIADQKLRYRRVAPYIIAEILEQFQKFTLYPAIRVQLVHGVYSLMSILDKHAVSQLLSTLPSGSREVFKMEYETFQKYHRYTGKV